MVNEKDLSEKFDELFVDDETIDAFHDWERRKEKAEDAKRSWLYRNQKVVIFLFFLSIIISLPFYLNRNRIEQHIRTYPDGDTKFSTILWMNGEIVKSFYTEPELVTDSLKAAQYSECQRILKSVK